MTKKIAISVPDDVAAHLAQQSNVSAYVTEAVRGRMHRDIVRNSLRERGHEITEASIAAARSEIDRIQASITPELRAQAEEFRAELERTKARYRR
ncbi:hypothetical protein [Catenuloplanes indicus]|uniref:F0F1-type ATP synthase membrane subunit b/b n=1 Tax=Catenuloplanes indicus TaxID=137267 RepID=A0AAE3VZ38_9ACTN|nr:hypothetical protein [Catenuloplanes indicus]MDQ0366414.1 F0F1-type ATP synthase membrane subunit b/b' [Catenuloplanes indicus]